MTAALRRLPVVTLDVRAVPQGDVDVRGFLGSVLHGALGAALHRVDRAAFDALSGAAGRGFRLRVEDGRLRLDEGRPFRAGVTLAGAATPHADAVETALVECLRDGIGPERMPCAVDGPWREDAELGAFAPAIESGEIELVLQSPVRLLADGIVLRALGFCDVARSLLRRAAALVGDLGDVRDLRAAADDVVAVASDLRMESRRRYSARQRATMNLLGLKGRVRYAGELAPFSDLLAVAAALGLGKATSFGFGSVAIASVPEAQPA